MSLVIDDRERQLIEMYTGPFTVETLDVGDVLCRYDDDPDKMWIGERKTAHDLARSIKDGRWREQRERLLEVGCRIVYIIEGDFAEVTSFSYESLLGATVNANLRKNSYMFRTFDLHETVRLISHLVAKMQRWTPGAPSGLQPPQTISKRKREESVENVWIRQLMCVPSVSETVARALLEEFGSLQKLQRALEGSEGMPRVRLGDRLCLGKTRVATLRAYLVDAERD